MSNKDSNQPKKAGRFFRPLTRNKKAKGVAQESIPRITTENIHEHREEVIGGAKKFIYPLKHSRHKIVIISVSIFVALLLGFMSYMLISLYKLQDTSKFMYQVTKILPFPIARVGGSFVAYEDYLFELRHYIHYFENQQELDFSSQSGQDQLKEQKKRALDQVVNETYIKKIAKEKNVTVSSSEIDKQIELLRSQNRLGGDNQVFEDVLRDFWGWTITDFRYSIKNEILKNKVVQSLDPQVKEKAQKALTEIKSGKEFALVAKEYSDDETTKDKGGELGFLVSKSDKAIPASLAEELFNLKDGEVSNIIDLGYGLAIIKKIGNEGDKIRAAHIIFSYENLDSYLNDYKDKQKTRVFIKVN